MKISLGFCGRAWVNLYRSFITDKYHYFHYTRTQGEYVFRFLAVAFRYHIRTRLTIKISCKKSVQAATLQCTSNYQATKCLQNITFTICQMTSSIIWFSTRQLSPFCSIFWLTKSGTRPLFTWSTLSNFITFTWPLYGFDPYLWNFNSASYIWNYV